jgi:hypothetical protein
VDYTKFLGQKEHVVLAYLGGAYVFGKDRRLRVDAPVDARPALGFHRFEVSGRKARALERADAAGSAELRDLPKVRGHFVAGWLVHGAGIAALDRLALLPEEEPAPFAVTRARRWHSGEYVFESLDFDTEAEDEARLRLEQNRALGDLKGVPATLRRAYGIALALATAARQHLPLSVREAAPHATRIADEGEPAARELMVVIDRERREAEERARIRAIVQGAALAAGGSALGRSGRVGGAGRGGAAPTPENAAERAENALDGAHARMLGSRRLSPLQIEVTWEFMGERFISVVDATTLQVYDSGVCLAGEDDLVTLDSLPGVIREAIETDRLVITRR